MHRVLATFALSALLLLPAARVLAADDVLAPGNPPLTRQVSDASAGVTVFLLQVVASGDADAALDRRMLDGWAQALASEYGRMSGDDQQALALMPALNSALHDAWSSASAADRNTVRDAFRPLAEGWLSDMSCDSFVSLADAGLVEATQRNIARYGSCEDEEDLVDFDEVMPSTPSAPVTASAPAPAPSAAPMSPTAAAQRASQGLLASHNMYVNMSNVLLQNHVGNMNAILNMGNNNYHYVYKP